MSCSHTLTFLCDIVISQVHLSAASKYTIIVLNCRNLINYLQKIHTFCAASISDFILSIISSFWVSFLSRSAILPSNSDKSLSDTAFLVSFVWESVILSSKLSPLGSLWRSTICNNTVTANIDNIYCQIILITLPLYCNGLKIWISHDKTQFNHLIFKCDNFHAISLSISEHCHSIAKWKVTVTVQWACTYTPKVAYLRYKC